MLRIELLPDYIHDKNKIRNLGVMWVVGLIIVAFLLLAWNGSAGSANEKAKQDREAKEALQKTTNDHKTAITAEETHRHDVETKQKFVKNSQLYNDGWPDVFETIRDVKPADNSIILDTMALDAVKHQTVSLTGFGQDERAIVRWWMSLRNNTVLFDHVNFDLVPHSFAPVDQASNNGGMGGPGGFGRMGPGIMGGSGGMGGPGSIMGNPNVKGSGPRAGMSGMGGSGGMGGMGRGGGSSATNGPGELAGRSGINFTASVVLKTALAGGIPTPSWPAGGGGGGGGGFGGFGGGPPGMGAMSGGGMSGGGGAISGGAMKGGGA